ncbi:integrator complex assembly factor WDR73 [Rhinophrynus dorsalis]
MESEAYDEWLVESISLYKDLHDFELQDPTRVIEWIGGKSICVAGYDRSKRNEILQLLVPQKLHTKENPGLCPERDLKVEHGGFIDEPVYCLKHIPESSLLVTSGLTSGPVRIWQIGAEDKDVIKPIGTIHSEAGKETWTKIATTTTVSPRVLHGSQANRIQLTEIESSKLIYTPDLTSSDSVSTLSFLDCNTFHVCCVNGRQYIADIRQPRETGEGSVAPSSAQWCATVKPWKQETCSAIASLSSEGHMMITDTRDLSTPLKCSRCSVPDPAPSEQFLCVCWAPELADCISISGFDGTVQIYNTQCWDGTMEEREALFTHRGHSVLGESEDGRTPKVTAHTWHPWKERTVLSTASDGSLHIWDWTNSHTKKDP